MNRVLFESRHCIVLFVFAFYSSTGCSFGERFFSQIQLQDQPESESHIVFDFPDVGSHFFWIISQGIPI